MEFRRTLVTRTGMALSIVLLGSLCGLGVSAQSCGTNWAPVTTMPSSATLRAVTYGGGQFVAVGDSGTVLTSPDGQTWTSQSSGTTDTLYDVTYGAAAGAGRFVAVGGQTALMSPDGASWESTALANANGLRAVTFGAGYFAAAGLSGDIFFSSNGTGWTKISPVTTESAYGLIFAGGRFVAVGSSGLIVSLSPTGSHTVFQTQSRLSLYGVAYGNGRFVAVGASGSILTSPDSSTWTNLAPPTTLDLYGVAYGSGLFVVVGSAGTLLTSTDGSHWTSVSSGTASDLDAATSDNSLLLVMGASGTALASNCQANLVHSISGTVTDGQGNPVASVTIGLSGIQTSTVYTGSDGAYSFTDLPDGVYSILPSQLGHSFTPPTRSVTLSGSDVTGQDFVQVTITPPAISSVAKAGNPFRLKVYGTNFHQGCTVKVNGTAVPQTLLKNSGFLIAKGGGALKAMVPRGTSVWVTVTNNDDGGISVPFSFSW